MLLRRRGLELWVGGGVVGVHVGVGREVTYHSTSVARAGWCMACGWLLKGFGRASTKLFYKNCKYTVV